ncbi:flagellar biosynthetic protein FliO [Pseudarthrobacter sp. PS3-L1]|uniref:flagellar biosynthetic protein FliO n=1 Tax=Pseudarthrobacter sp. PS3-L1 TaxID=3046207 RepID=UPI0024B8D909|nr:flagellar biosynthetic protein FliO [Pseudarthrobacter sp. PS3-L1]MDJ0319344.1 flagellar biosynthetic protein FliO [Pseudarthrobacter sp. PS3-L1]
MDALILGLRVLVSLGAVLGLMWFLQKRLSKGTGRRRANTVLSVVSRQSLSAKTSVVVVDAAGQRFILGVTDHAINVLHSCDIPLEPESVDDVVGAQVPSVDSSVVKEQDLTTSAAGFARVLADAGSMPTRSSVHRDHSRRGARTHPPLHGSILAGSTWKQAAAALRSGRRP